MYFLVMINRVATLYIYYQKAYLRKASIDPNTYLSKLLERERTMGSLLHYSPKFYHNVFLFVALTTFGPL